MNPPDHGVTDPPAASPRQAFRSWRFFAAVEDGELASRRPPAEYEAPLPHPEHQAMAVERSFGFLDIAGFTAYCDRNGEHDAVELLARFRETTRMVSARRGVRVAKWLGDGVMLVALDPAGLAATIVEVAMRCSVHGLDTHAGLATGDALLFEGDDYVGRAVNVAARLSDAAAPGEILLAGGLADLPPWIEQTGASPVVLPGVDDPVAVARLSAQAAIVDQFGAAFDVA
jgi:class 3 adenylate cyclase